MADEVRFELTMDLHPRQFSRLVQSTALPLIRFLGVCGKISAVFIEFQSFRL